MNQPTIENATQAAVQASQTIAKTSAAAEPPMSNSSAWLILILAGVMEVGMALGLKYAHGFTKPWPSVAAVVFGAVSMYLLSVSLKVLPAGVGYAAWTGIGAVGVLVVGMLFLKEPFNLLRLVCVLLIIAGVAGLHASTLQR
jgi:quaternary ammonium compound-resistance protein SugE